MKILKYINDLISTINFNPTGDLDQAGEIAETVVTAGGEISDILTNTTKQHGVEVTIAALILAIIIIKNLPRIIKGFLNFLTEI